jgi:epoxyqueuosine reductase QueG
MLEDLRKEHARLLNQVKLFLDTNQVKYAIPPATPKDNGEHRAEFSYKWAAIHAGLGFIGKNDVFVHYKYAQRTRISCLLINHDLPVFEGDIVSKCGKCSLCVDACPYKFITGNMWHINTKREELIDFRKCAIKSNRYKNYLCARCSLACTYPNIVSR